MTEQAILRSKVVKWVLRRGYSESSLWPIRSLYELLLPTAPFEPLLLAALATMLSLSAILFSAVVGLLLYRYFIYPVFISPLSKIPSSHFTAPFCPAWILWVRYSRIETRTLLSCHERLRPFIRLGPNEVSVNCVDGGVRTIYNGEFKKPGWSVNRFGTYGYFSFDTTKLKYVLNLIEYSTCSRPCIAKHTRFARE